MALLPPEYLQSVVALGYQTDGTWTPRMGQPMETFATGFLYGFPILDQNYDKNNDSGLRLWLVTCKHVVQAAIDLGEKEILVRLNKVNQTGMQPFKISLDNGNEPRWTFHDTEDVAVIPASWKDLEDKGAQWKMFAAGRNAIAKDEADKIGISEGDGVFIIGFPVGWRPAGQDYPIVRQGVFAQIRGWLNHEHKTFLVDGSGFPGNSGGPAVTKPQYMGVPGTKNVSASLLN